MFICKSKLLPSSVGFLLFWLLCTSMPTLVDAQKTTTIDTTAPKPVGPLPFPIQDRRGDFMSSGGNSTYDFKKPSNITDSISYDFRTQLYTVYEKIGNKFYRTPVTYTSEEYWQLRGRQSEIDYLESGPIP
jgi:hypothetical protein